MERVKALPGDGLIITARGETVDFVSRYFAPHAGIPEDPVTGSAHVVLTPFWSARLGKKILRARQVSARGGEMLSVKDVEEVLGLKTIGVIPESGDVLNASNKGEPVILDMESAAGQAYDDAVARRSEEH